MQGPGKQAPAGRRPTQLPVPDGLARAAVHHARRGGQQGIPGPLLQLCRHRRGLHTGMLQLARQSPEQLRSARLAHALARLHTDGCVLVGGLQPLQARLGSHRLPSRAERRPANLPVRHAC